MKAKLENKRYLLTNRKKCLEMDINAEMIFYLKVGEFQFGRNTAVFSR